MWPRLPLRPDVLPLFRGQRSPIPTRFLGAPSPYAPGDVAGFDDLTKANGFILSGAAIDAAWDTAGPNGTPLKGAFMAGRPPGVQVWSYQGPPLDQPIPASFLTA